LKKLAISVNRLAPNTPHPTIDTFETSKLGFGAALPDEGGG
jgi:hypothetical protein